MKYGLIPCGRTTDVGNLRITENFEDLTKDWSLTFATCNSTPEGTILELREKIKGFPISVIELEGDVGPGAMRNALLNSLGERKDAEYFAFFDADDTVSENYFREFDRASAVKTNRVLVCNSVYQYNKKSLSWNFVDEPERFDYYPCRKETQTQPLSKNLRHLYYLSDVLQAQCWGKLYPAMYSSIKFPEGLFEDFGYLVKFYQQYPQYDEKFVEGPKYLWYKGNMNALTRTTSSPRAIMESLINISTGSEFLSTVDRLALKRRYTYAVLTLIKIMVEADELSLEDQLVEQVTLLLLGCSLDLLDWGIPYREQAGQINTIDDILTSKSWSGNLKSLILKSMARVLFLGEGFPVNDTYNLMSYSSKGKQTLLFPYKQGEFSTEETKLRQID